MKPVICHHLTLPEGSLPKSVMAQSGDLTPSEQQIIKKMLSRLCSLDLLADLKHARPNIDQKRQYCRIKHVGQNAMNRTDPSQAL